MLSVGLNSSDLLWCPWLYPGMGLLGRTTEKLEAEGEERQDLCPWRV